MTINVIVSTSSSTGISSFCCQSADGFHSEASCPNPGGAAPYKRRLFLEGAWYVYRTPVESIRGVGRGVVYVLVVATVRFGQHRGVYELCDEGPLLLPQNPDLVYRARIQERLDKAPYRLEDDVKSGQKMQNQFEGIRQGNGLLFIAIGSWGEGRNVVYIRRPRTSAQRAS